MKVVFVRDTYNTGKIKTLKLTKATHKGPNDAHIPKGFQIEIGTGDLVNHPDMRKEDSELLAHLFLAGCIATAEGEQGAKNIKRINDEIEVDRVREENAARRNQETLGSATMHAITNLVNAAVAKAQKA